MKVRDFLVFIFVLAVIFLIIIIFLFSIKKQDNIFSKLYKVYSKDSSYKCNLNKKCTKTFTKRAIVDNTTINYTINLEMNYNEFKLEESYYQINIQSDIQDSKDKFYFLAFLQYDDIRKETGINFRTSYNDNIYSGYYKLDELKIQSFDPEITENYQSYNDIYDLTDRSLYFFVQIINNDLGKTTDNANVNYNFFSEEN